MGIHVVVEGRWIECLRHWDEMMSSTTLDLDLDSNLG